MSDETETFRDRLIRLTGQYGGETSNEEMLTMLVEQHADEIKALKTELNRLADVVRDTGADMARLDDQW